MHKGWILPLLLFLPTLLAGLGMLASTPRMAVRLLTWGTLASAGASVAAALLALNQAGELKAMGAWLMVDALSAYHLLVMAVVFSLSGLYSRSYFEPDLIDGSLSLGTARRFAALWFASMAAMNLVLVSNNLGLMWVGIEATTLVTAFLICIHATPTSLEAMWKYLLMCSVGVALAFMGTLLLAAATHGSGVEGADALLWTELRDSAARLNPKLVKIAFLFLVVGYGTKAGLAPMHNWLPDAHSQAPAPVSAIFSGFLLNAALYCILRTLPLVEALPGNAGWGREILVAFGLISILVAAVFIIAQHDVKRLLAYSSVEHLGIVALGVGLGGLGYVAALFHIFNNSVSKSVGFFCAGSIGKLAGTHDMRKINRVMALSKVWGGGLTGSLLAIIGAAPFALFLSEFLILHTAIQQGHWFIAGAFLFGLALVFIGALRHLISISWEPHTEPVTPHRATLLEGAIVFVPLATLLMLGVYVPAPFWHLLEKAARILGGAS
ncbi:hydrogenase 4 subunit F [Myxococcota bacterium]|nr:hydrogenase 4 subunit F [Myxococcota bacterium]